MCFSAAASFSAGVALVALGTATLRLCPAPPPRPFAAIPLLFGLQQLVEGAVWLSLGPAPTLPGGPPAMLYSLFAHVLWPLYLPWAVRARETVARRRRALRVAQAAGLVVAAYFLAALLVSPPVPRSEGAHILYDFDHLQLTGGLALYLLATCGSSLWSSHRGVRSFGLLSLAGFGATLAISLAALVSVWCFVAALLSTAVYLIVRADARHSGAVAAPVARTG